MLAIRSIILVFALFFGKLLKSFYEHSSVQKAGLDNICLKMLKSHNSVAHDLTHVQLLIQKLKVLLKSLFTNMSHNVAIIRRTSYIHFK